MKLEKFYKVYKSLHERPSTYSLTENLRFQKASRILTEIFADEEREIRLLDIGCGCGPLASFLPQREFHLIGIEINKDLAQVASQAYDRVICQDVEDDWKVEDESIDAVFMAAVLEHIFDYHFLLNEANRVLRKGGALLVQVPNLGYWKEVRKVILRKQPHWARDMQHIHLWTKAFLKEILQKHQFEVKAFEADRINLPLFRWVKSIWLEKKLASWGPVLIATAFKECTAKIVDGRLAHLYKKVDEIDKRTVEVVED